MQAPRTLSLCCRFSRPRDSLITLSVSQIVAKITFVILLALAVVFPASLMAVTGAPDTGGAPTQEGLTRGELLIIAAVALFFAFLGLLKDFHRYRGLLHLLIWNGYSWLFLGFTTMGIFAIDYIALQQLHQHVKLIHEDLMRHISLILGHTTVSAAFAYVSPFILRVIPTQSKAALSDPSPLKKPEEEKPTTEMNVVFAAIRESLENRVNGKVYDWALNCSWPVIRSTGRMLLTDLHQSGTISQEQFESGKTLEASYQPCADVWDDRQVKYELLRIMMTRSSYHDLSLRLARTAKAERVGPIP